MAQASMTELLQRLQLLESQIQELQQELRQVQGPPAAGQDRFGDIRTVTPAIPPAMPEPAKTEPAAQDPVAPPLPDFDPYAWGTLKPGQSHAARRQEIVQIQERRQASKQAQADQQVLNMAESDIDLPPPQDPLEAATAFANERKARLAQEPAFPTKSRPDASWTPSEPRLPGTERQPTQPPLPPPYTPQPDTNTQIPQPPDWKDSPERLTRGPVNQQPQQQSFGQMQATFDAAVARQMEMLAGFVQDATRRIEELECWREAFCQE